MPRSPPRCPSKHCRTSRIYPRRPNYLLPWRSRHPLPGQPPIHAPVVSASRLIHHRRPELVAAPGHLAPPGVVQVFSAARPALALVATGGRVLRQAMRAGLRVVIAHAATHLPGVSDRGLHVPAHCMAHSQPISEAVDARPCKHTEQGTTLRPACHFARFLAADFSIMTVSMGGDSSVQGVQRRCVR
jgi:hypothetical protein